MINMIRVISTKHSVFVLNGTPEAKTDAREFTTLLAEAGFQYSSTMLSAEYFERRVTDGFFGKRRIRDMRDARPAPRRAAAPVLVPA
jgi:hypothetical protein